MLARALTFRRDAPVRPERHRGFSRLDSRALKSWRRPPDNSINSPEYVRARDATKEEIRAGPRRALRRHVGVYVQFLRYVVIFSLIMFAIFAFESYAVRNILCKRLIHDRAGPFLGLHECIYGGWANYNPYQGQGAAIVWLIFYSIQYMWLVSFSMLIAMALYPDQVLIWHKVVAVVLIFLQPLMLCIAGPVMHLDLDNYVLMAISVVCSSIMLTVTGDIVGRHPGSSRVMVARWVLLFMLSSAAAMSYIMLVPFIITSRSGDALSGTGILIVRMIIHPIVWMAVTSFMLQFLRHRGSMPGMMQICFLMFPLVYSSVFGRFLLLQLDSAGSVFLINLAQACYLVGTRLSDRADAGLWLSFLYGERGAEARIATRIVEELRLMEMLASSLAENGGIIAASALMSFGHISTDGDSPPNHGLIWLNAAGQIITGLAVDFLGIVIESRFHAFDFRRVLPKSMLRTMTFSIIVLVIGSSRLAVELLILFCPVVKPGYGIVLRQCDRDSIFQAIDVRRAAKAP